MSSENAKETPGIKKIEPGEPAFPRVISGCGIVLQAFVYLYLLFADMFTAFSMSPWMADIVVDWGVVADKKKSGYVTGLITTCNAVGLALGSCLWVRLSKTVGRRPCLLLGAMMNSLTPFLMAFSPNFVYFLILRFLQGLFNCTLVLTKVSLGEDPLMPPKTIVSAFSCLTGSVAVAKLISPLLGGFLARPVQQYGLDRHNGIGWFLARFPLLIPMLICSFVNLVGGFLALFCLRETHRGVLRAVDDEQFLRFEELNEKADVDVELKERENDDDDFVSDFGNLRFDAPDPIPFDELNPPSRDPCCAALKKPFLNFARSEVNAKEPISLLLIYFLIGVSTTLSVSVPTFVFPFSLLMVRFARTVPILLSVEASSGGIGLKNYEIGILGNVGGVFQVIAAIATPFFFRWCNTIWIMRIVLLLLGPLLIPYPELNHFALMSETWARVILWVLLCVLTFIMSCGVHVAYADVLVLTNNSISTEGKGQMQAIANLVGHAGKGLGPFLGNALLSVGLEVDVFPVDEHFCLFLGTAGFLVCALVAFLFLSPQLSMPKEERLRILEKQKLDKEEDV